MHTNSHNSTVYNSRDRNNPHAHQQMAGLSSVCVCVCVCVCAHVCIHICVYVCFPFCSDSTVVSLSTLSE